MFSLNRKYLLLNGLCTALSIGAIAWFFQICNGGFTDLVDISAKNLNALYTAGELKSLLWKEIAFKEKLPDEKSAQSLYKTAQSVSMLAENLKHGLKDDPKRIIEQFIAIHNRIHREEALKEEEWRRLFAEAYGALNEFGELVLIRSQEQQGRTIREARTSMWVAMLSTIAFTLAILSLSFLYFRNRIIRRIVAISSKSLQVARGNYEKVHEDGDKDELGLLAGNFNHMVREIQESEDMIRKERDAAESANRAKSLFLANMSHELRTPMHGILSYARFGQQKFETATKEKLKSYFDEIYDSGARLMSLLNEILDLSKLEAGKMEYTMEPADLGAVFDQVRIMQVARNILSNAVKFSSPGSSIRIRLSAEAHIIRCCIANRGVGIPPEELQTIFDKFIQSSKTRTGAGGTGLGLAICKEIVEHHGGRIWAESDPDGETRFLFELPKPESALSAA